MIIVMILMLMFSSPQNGHLTHLHPYGSGPGAPHNVVIQDGTVIEWTLAHGD